MELRAAKASNEWKQRIIVFVKNLARDDTHTHAHTGHIPAHSVCLRVNQTINNSFKGVDEQFIEFHIFRSMKRKHENSRKIFIPHEHAL